MLPTNCYEVLFPHELSPCEGVLGIIAALRHPNRTRATGAKCVNGFSVSFRREGSTNVWFSVDPLQKQWDSLDSTLSLMPALAYPMSTRIIHEFLDVYILQNWDVESIPTFLSSSTLHGDIKQRVELYQLEIEELLKLFLARKVEITDFSRDILDENNQAHLIGQPDKVFFTRVEAGKYLERKGYLNNALEFGTSWREIVSEPTISILEGDEIGCCFGYPKMLKENGIDRYRNWLRLQRPSKHQDSDSKKVSPKDGGSFKDNSSEPNVKHSSFVTRDASLNEACTRDQKIFDSNAARRSDEMMTSNNLHVHSPTTNSINHAIPQVPTEKVVLNQSSEEKDLTLIGVDVVCKLAGYERASIYSFGNQKNKYFDPNFPKSEKNNGVKKWYKTEIQDWIKVKMKRAPNT